MKKILDNIVLTKHMEVEIRKSLCHPNELEQTEFFYRQPLSLSASLLDPQKTSIIAEFKRRSPSKGIINDKVSVMDVTGDYSMNGASGISVLTDHDYFGGSDDDLKAVAAKRSTPLLRKDFTIDPYQVLEARAIGADAILLIAAILDKKQIRDLSKLAFSLGLEVLLELHAEEELDKVDPDIQLIGINNRNLQSFEVSLEHSIRLADKLPEGVVKIAESGIHSPETLIELGKNGFDGFLIGEYFMRTENPGKTFSAFCSDVKALKQKKA